MLFDNDFSFLELVNTNNELVSANEGFQKGNMFANEYIPYKNYTYISIKPKSDRESMLLNIMQYSFAINDLNLYLDLNPEDTKILIILKELIELEKKEKEKYVSTYGPLDICDTNTNTFNWINNPWPWEGEGGIKYV